MMGAGWATIPVDCGCEVATGVVGAAAGAAEDGEVVEAASVSAGGGAMGICDGAMGAPAPAESPCVNPLVRSDAAATGVGGAVVGAVGADGTPGALGRLVGGTEDETPPVSPVGKPAQGFPGIGNVTYALRRWNPGRRRCHHRRYCV